MLAFTPVDLIKIVVAMLLGGIIGFEREMHNKSAGLRTIVLISMGAAMFTILSSKFSSTGTPAVAANIVTGVGFLGAGVIMFAEGRVKGLTTASTVWMAAALGMAVGLGEYILGVATAVLVFIVLDLFTRMDGWLENRGRSVRSYEIAFSDRAGKEKEIEAVFGKYGLRIQSHLPMREGQVRRDGWQLVGRTDDHQAMVEALLEDKEISDLHY